jgi:hypothetical protein
LQHWIPSPPKPILPDFLIARCAPEFFRSSVQFNLADTGGRTNIFNHRVVCSRNPSERGIRNEKRQLKGQSKKNKTKEKKRQKSVYLATCGIDKRKLGNQDQAKKKKHIPARATEQSNTQVVVREQ